MSSVRAPTQAALRWLAALQVNTGLSASQIAKRAGLSTSTLTRPAKDGATYIRVDTLLKIARAMRVPLPRELRGGHHNGDGVDDASTEAERLMTVALQLEDIYDPDRRLSASQRAVVVEQTMRVLRRAFGAPPPRRR